MQQMQDNYDPHRPFDSESRRRGMPWWGWLILALVTLIVLPCFGCIGWVAYIGSVGPDTGVYTGNKVPAKFEQTVVDVGALGPDETILYFYSDGVTDIRNGFYFVSDKRIVIYSEYAAGDPLTVIEFDEVEGLNLSRDTSFFTDSQIYLDLKDGTPISFPVSSDNDGDERFFEAIREKVGRAE
jgi:hypothetical protein